MEFAGLHRYLASRGRGDAARVFIHLMSFNRRKSASDQPISWKSDFRAWVRRFLRMVMNLARLPSGCR